MAAAPPVIKIGPPPAKTKGRTSLIDQWFAAHKGMGQYQQAIDQWAGQYGVNPLWIASVVWKESKGINSPWDPKMQGSGLVQLNISPDGVSNAPALATQALGRKPTYQDAMNPSTAIQILAYTMAFSNSTTVDDFYQRVWNPNFKPTAKNVLPSTYLKGYGKVQATGYTPPQKAAGAAATTQAKAANTVDAQYKARSFLDPIYMAYTGRRATPAEITQYIRNPISQYQIETTLSDPKQNPRIFKSPIWATNSDRYDAYYRQIYGDNAAAPKNVLLYAVVHNLDQAAFQDELMHGKIQGAPAYTTSEKFKGDMADATKVYANIYGTPDETGNTFLKSAVLGGWNQSQIENYLRAQPEYTSSAEYKTRAIDLASRMGLIQGTGAAQTALQGATPNG